MNTAHETSPERNAEIRKTNQGNAVPENDLAVALRAPQSAILNLEHNIGNQAVTRLVMQRTFISRRGPNDPEQDSTVKTPVGGVPSTSIDVPGLSAPAGTPSPSIPPQSPLAQATERLRDGATQVLIGLGLTGRAMELVAMDHRELIRFTGRLITQLEFIESMQQNEIRGAHDFEAGRLNDEILNNPRMRAMRHTEYARAVGQYRRQLEQQLADFTRAVTPPAPARH